MKPYTRSIVDLFDGKKRFLIPLYQRQYAWRVEPQLRLLWEDVERIAKRLVADRMSVVPHFLGAIVIAQIKTFGKQVQAYEIIDGQQRLTTFQILLAAMRDVAAEHQSGYAVELQKYLLNDGVMETPESERYKLFPSITDRRAFISVIDPTADIDDLAPPPAYDEGYVKRATSAHEYFKDVIRKSVLVDDVFDEHKLEILFETLKEGLAIVSIELEGGDDPQTIFETLNSRGVELSPGDLMRNFIFQRAKGLGQENGSLKVDKLYGKHWLPLDRPFWSENASRGRQSRARLDWLLTDHLSMNIGNIVSVDTLYESYRRWILNERPFPSVIPELEAISASASVEQRLFEQEKNDPLGDFGRFAHAFDVSTVMPLVLYLATEAKLEDDLQFALAVLKSFILRRDICGLTTKNYNKLFVGMIPRLRETTVGQVDALRDALSERTSDIDRWPDDEEWHASWTGRDQYGSTRQLRLHYIFEMIEKELRNERNEDIEIKSSLTIEHIMPQKWKDGWPIPGYEATEVDELDPAYRAKVLARNLVVDKLGNLTLLTQKLNSSVSNGPYSVKMPALRAHSSLSLNRDLNAWGSWDETTIRDRAEALFKVARRIWQPPIRGEGFKKVTGNSAATPSGARSGLPEDGTRCEFTYGGKVFQARIENGEIAVDGYSERYRSFSAASRAVTRTSRNGWNDWYLNLGDGPPILADDWRKGSAG